MTDADQADARKAYRKDGLLRHSDGCRMAFGRLDPENCARCEQRAQERKDGIPARADHGAGRRTRDNDARRSVEIHAHFNSSYHRSGKCGVCCTFGDW